MGSGGGKPVRQALPVGAAEGRAAQGYLDTAKAYQEAGTGDFISAAIKGVAGIGEIAAAFAAAPATGGMSLGGAAALAAAGAAA